MTRKDLNGYKIPHNPNQKRGGRCSKADHGPQVIDRPCPKCGFQWGGGRESGNPGSVGGAESTRAAAANPACPDCEDFRQIVDPVPRHVHWCHERIRELEHMEKLLEARAEEAEARVKELTAELKWANEELGKIYPHIQFTSHELRGEDGPDPDEKECLG